MKKEWRPLHVTVMTVNELVEQIETTADSTGIGGSGGCVWIYTTPP